MNYIDKLIEDAEILEEDRLVGKVLSMKITLSFSKHCVDDEIQHFGMERLIDGFKYSVREHFKSKTYEGVREKLCRMSYVLRHDPAEAEELLSEVLKEIE